VVNMIPRIVIFVKYTMFLYCIANSSGSVKFGFSKDPDRRLRSLQTGCEEELVLLETVRVPEDHVREYERLLHKEFAHLRTRGEWFKISGEDAVPFLQWFSIHYLSDLD
jgi:hypothetical protein